MFLNNVIFFNSGAFFKKSAIRLSIQFYLEKLYTYSLSLFAYSIIAFYTFLNNTTKKYYLIVSSCMTGNINVL